MTVLQDVHKMREDLAALRRVAEGNRDIIARHEEQINGKRGLQTAIDELTEQVESLRRAIITVGGGIVLSAVGFGLSVLTLVG